GAQRNAPGVIAPAVSRATVRGVRGPPGIGPRRDSRSGPPASAAPPLPFPRRGPTEHRVRSAGDVHDPDHRKAWRQMPGVEVPPIPDWRGTVDAGAIGPTGFDR